MAANELGGGVDHNVSAVFNGTDQIGGAECIIDYQRQSIFVSNVSNGVNVRNITVGVAQGLNVDGLGVGLDRMFHGGEVVDIHKAGVDAVEWQGVGQQITGAAVDGLLCYNVLPLFCKRLNGIGDRGGARGDSQTGNTALQCGNALFKNTLGGIGQAAIDVACISQTKAICCVLTVMKYIRSGSVDGNRTGIRCRVRVLLAHMELERFKFVIRHSCVPFCSMIYFARKNR